MMNINIVKVDHRWNLLTNIQQQFFSILFENVILFLTFPQLYQVILFVIQIKGTPGVICSNGCIHITAEVTC